MNGLHQKWMKKPAYRKAYDDLELEFQLKEALIRARIERGMTQKQIAKRAGTKQSAISRFERGGSNPTVGFVQKVARAVGTRITLVPQK